MSQENQTTVEMAETIENLLVQMQSKFEEMSNSILSRVDTMGDRIDDLEKNISKLLEDSNAEAE